MQPDRSIRLFSVACWAVLLGTSMAWSQWSDDFDSYATDSTINGQGQWEGWDLSASDADVTDEEAASAPNSLRLRTDTDVVVVFRGFTEGVWTARAMTYIPFNHTGQTFYILLNTYNHAGAKNWSTQIVFENGMVTSQGGSGFGGGGALPSIADEWIELKVEIDFDLNLQIITYDGQFLDQTPWQVSGINEIQAIDIFSDNGSPAYYDDLSIVQEDLGIRPNRDVSLTGACPDPDPLQVTVTQPVPEGANAADEVTVTERVFGTANDTVSPQNGGVKSDVVPEAISEDGWIKSWLISGYIPQGGGAAPAVEVMRQDYLDDGAGINEIDYEPSAWDVIEPLATGGAEITVQPVNTSGGLVDFEVLLGGSDNVVVYMWTYVNVEDDIQVDLCIGSDDSVQAFVDGDEVWINSIARAWDGVSCQDLVVTHQTTGDPIFLEEGTHLICLKIFEGGGGHRGGLQILDSATALPAEGLSICGDPACQGPLVIGTEIVWNVTRQQVADGVGYTVDIDRGQLSFSGDVEGIRTIGDRTAAVCPPALSPSGDFLPGAFLAYGPFAPAAGTQLPCGGLPEELQLNYIAPENILCFAPVEGEEFEFHPGESVMDLYLGPTGPNGGPIARRYGGTLPNLNTDIGGNDRMMWLITYVEYLGDQPLNAEFCFGSDDSGALVWDDRFEHLNNVCRGVGTACAADFVPVTVEPGVHRLAIAAFNRGGGWGLHLALRAGGIPIGPDDPDFIFHGVNKPAEFQELECPACVPGPVMNLSCVRDDEGFIEVTWDNPVGCENEDNIRILVRGEEVAALDPDATSHTIDPQEVEFASSVSVDNGSFTSPSCSLVEVLGVGTGALLGDDLTDLGDDGVESLYFPPGNLGGFDGIFFSSDEPGFEGGEFAFNAFDNLLGPGNAKWCCGTVFPQIVGVDFSETQETEFLLTHFTVASANDTPGRDPRVWSIEGSNDGEVWTTIFSQDDPNAALWTARLQVLRFEEGRDYPEQTESYSMFRMVTEQTGLTAGAFFQLGEIELFGESVDEPHELNCSDDVDNDGDGQTDCDDPDCELDPACEEGGFDRGDSNADGSRNITDGVYIFSFLFTGGPPPPCMDSADTSDQGSINITSGIYILNFLFLGGPAPPPPFDECGDDPTGDNLECESFPPCEG